jgi:hypothetical protein
MYKPNISHWEHLICEIREEIKAQFNKNLDYTWVTPNTTFKEIKSQCNKNFDYAKELCDVLESEMVNYARLQDTELYYVPQIGSKEESVGPEWHYVKDGYFPPEGKRVLVFWSNTYGDNGVMWEHGNVSLGYYVKDWDEDFENENFWLDDNDEDELHEVLCWKEIGKFPKEAFKHPVAVNWSQSDTWDEDHKWYAYHDLGEHTWNFDCSNDGSYPKCCVCGWFPTLEELKGYLRYNPQG